MNKLKSKKQLNNNPLDYFTPFDENRSRVSFTPHKGGVFSYDIYDIIESPAQFTDLINALTEMEAEDQMIINLHSAGGCLQTTDTILHALRKAKGDVHFVATGIVASAATILLLSAKSFELSENFTALIHCGSIEDGGNFNEVKQSFGFHIKHMEKFLRNSYAGFMSEQEIEDMLNGKDFLLDAKGWYDRYEKRNKWLVEKRKVKPRKMKKANTELNNSTQTIQDATQLTI